jgi:apolipoprotein N-acyltransferase
VAWVALVPLFAAILLEPYWRWSCLYGLIFGIVYHGVDLAWIFLFGWMAWTALTLVLALYPAAAALIASVARGSRLAPLYAAGAWAGAELVRDRWPVGGFPWGSAGTTQGGVPGVRWLAGTIGVYGLTFLVALAAAVLATRFVGGRLHARSLAGAAAVLLVFVAVDASLYSSPPRGSSLDVTLIQGNVPRPPRPGQRALILRSFEELTRAEGARADVIVWPEDSVGIGAPADATDRVAALATSLGRPILFGRSTVDPSREAFVNTVTYMSRTGRVEGVYEKRHPVPFGEYVPFPSWRRFITTLQAEVPYDLVPGRRAVVFDVRTTTREGRVTTARIATPICFESVFPRDFLDFARRGAEMYVLSTNNASFERSYASQQHLAHTRMRALETRQWVAQAALSGITAFVAPDGRISGALPLFETGVSRGVVGLRPAHSLYARTGDLFPAIFAVAAGAGALGALVRRRRKAELISEA